MSEIKYGEFTIVTAKLPEASVTALLRRGLAHFLGNEQASKVAAEFKDNAEATQAEKDKFKAGCVTAALQALQDGTVGANTRGPRGTAIDTVIRGLAEKEVRDALKHLGVTMPSGDKVVKFADGQELTRAQLIDRRVAKHGERLKKEAEVEMNRREREAAKVGSLDDLI